jgi:tRNA modification GTPase
VLSLFDVADPVEEILLRKKEMEEKGLKFLLVGNKVDAVDKKNFDSKLASVASVILISAKEGRGVEELKAKMADVILKGNIHTESTIVTNARHYHALVEAEKSLGDIKLGLDNRLPGDLLALDIRRCLHYLGEITGEVNNEEMLDWIFSKFCIGK